MDNRILVFLVTIGAVILAILIGTAVASSELFVPMLALVALMGISMLALPEVAAFFAVALFASGLTAPGLPGQFGLYYVFVSAVMGCAILAVVFRKAPTIPMTTAHWLLLGFSAVVLITGLRRGMGFQFLGSSMWGGFFYIQILMSALLVFMLPRVNMPAPWWPRAIAWMGLLAPLPLLADILVLKGAALIAVRMFMQNGGGLATNLADQEAGGGIGRLLSAGIAAPVMLAALLSSVPTNRFFQVRSWWAILLLGIIFTLSLISGFRLITALLVAMLVIAAYVQGSITLPRAIGGFTMATIGLAMLYKTVEWLPYSVQRAVSWLPGIGVSAASSQDAEGTLTWRLDLWQQALHSIPEYFWLGKGFSYDANLYLAAQSGYASYDAINWALLTGAYHNGYLSLLLVTGIFGFLMGLPLLVIVVFRHIRIQRSPWKSARLKLCHVAFLIAQACHVAIYLTIYGDVTASFPPFLFYWAILESLRECDQRIAFSTNEAEPNSTRSRREEELAFLE